MKRFIFATLLICIIALTACNKTVPKVAESPSPTPSIKYFDSESAKYKVPIMKDWEVLSPPQSDVMLRYTEGTYEPLPSISFQSIKMEEFDVWAAEGQKKIQKEIAKNLKTAESKNIKIQNIKAYNLVYGIENKYNSIIIDQRYLFHNGYLIVITIGAREEEYNRFHDIAQSVLDKVAFY